MRDDANNEKERAEAGAEAIDGICPVCGGQTVQERCKVVCRSARCIHRIVLTCAEF